MDKFLRRWVIFIAQVARSCWPFDHGEEIQGLMALGGGVNKSSFNLMGCAFELLLF